MFSGGVYLGKHTLCLLLACVLSLAACGSAPAAPAASPEAPAAEEPAVVTEAEAPVSEPEAAETEPAPETHCEILVVYFSATGTTRGVAEKIAALTGGDLAEIVPAKPYTAEDLNYNDRSARATVEQNTPDARPEIANDISLEGYTTVYLGYPIWWGDTPRILLSFVEDHDFTGITVIPFCTSGSSGAGRTGETLGEHAGTGTFLSSTRLDAGISNEKLQDWIGGKK